MKTKKTEKERPGRPGSGKAKAEALHPLSYQILRWANRGLARVDFQKEVSKVFLAFSKCDAIEFWLKDHEKYYRCKASREANGNPKIQFLPPVRSFPFPLEAGRKSYLLDTSKDLRSHPRLLIPLVVESKQVGMLQLRSQRKASFTKSKVELYETLGQDLGMAVAHRHAQADLRERVKELTCLYGIALLVARPDLTLEQMLQEMVQLLPPAWLYPEIASARIVLDGCSYRAPRFHESPYKQSAPIVIDGEQRGVVELVYGEEKPDLDEGPFMKEERSLIEAVAKELATIIKRKQAEEDKLKLQEQLRHADRLATIGQLAAGVAHELNEPLANILGFAQLSKKCPGLPPQAEQDIEKVLTASLYAREVVKKLLLSARQMLPQKMKVNLNRVIEEGLFFFESRCAKEKIELVRILAPDLPKVIADPAQLNQVVVNLVVNALHAMPKGGQLTVRTSAEGDHVSLVIGDTGTGMNEETLKKIFTPFFTTKEVGQGTGLGLPVVHGIITSHGGSIHVQSKVGQGTRFEIRLPIKDSGDFPENHGNGTA